MLSVLPILIRQTPLFQLGEDGTRHTDAWTKTLHDDAVLYQCSDNYPPTIADMVEFRKAKRCYGEATARERECRTTVSGCLAARVG